MANKKITFGKPKTPGTQPAFVPELAPENVDNRLVYDFGNKYAVLESKFKNLKDGAVYTAGFDIQQEVGYFIFTTTFFHADGKALSSSSVEVPEGTPIESVELDYENKQLVIHTVGGEDIIADLSELINKVETLESQVEEINSAVFIPDVITGNENITLVEVGDVLSNDLDLGERGEQEDGNLNLDVQKTIAFYNKPQIDERISNLIYEVSVGTGEQEPDFARTWFRPAETYEEEPMIQMSTEFTVLYNDGPEVGDGSFIESSIEEEPGISDNELSMMSFEDNEQDIGFSEGETSGFVDDGSNNENTLGFSENEVSSFVDDGSNNENILGFSEDEVSSFVDDSSGNENSVGFSDSDVEEQTENDIELIPGFSDNEIK